MLEMGYKRVKSFNGGKNKNKKRDLFSYFMTVVFHRILPRGFEEEAKTGKTSMEIMVQG